MEREIKFTITACRWFDKTHGNTYHSVRIERVKDGFIICSDSMVYGYGDQYVKTAYILLVNCRWIPKEYRPNSEQWRYERENDYPIQWIVNDGLKRDMVANANFKRIEK